MLKALDAGGTIEERVSYMSEALLETRGLKKYFSTPKGPLHAVDGINVKITRGSTLGVVGESGCGKSTLGRTVLRLLEATEGEVLFEGTNILKSDKHALNKAREQMQMIFQDPYASLNPRMSVSEIIGDPLRVCKKVSGKKDLEQQVSELMDTVGLASRFVNAYPHELDGGRRQRVGVARALALNPKFIVCDEPVSALDVSIQAQILNLMMDLQEEKNLTYMFITHDLSVVRHISTEIMVMYLGQCVEIAPAKALFKNPLHPYTQVLLDAIPIPSLEYARKKRSLVRGEITNPINPKPGCRFAGRCAQVMDACTQGDCQQVEMEPGHFVACQKFQPQ